MVYLNIIVTGDIISKALTTGEEKPKTMCEMIERLNAPLKEKIQKLENTITEKDNELAKKDDKLTEKDAEIASLKAEVARLKSQQKKS